MHARLKTNYERLVVCFDADEIRAISGPETKGLPEKERIELIEEVH